MLKPLALIDSLVQQLDMAAFGLHVTSISKVLNASTNMPQKQSKLFLYPSWLNQHTPTSTCLRSVTVSCIFMISIH